MSTARDLGLDPNATPPTLPPVTLRDGNPLIILAACRSVARKVGWTLAAWDEFSATCKACFSPAASREEVDAMLDVVRSHFAVTLGPSFSFDPAEWDRRQVRVEVDD